MLKMAEFEVLCMWADACASKNTPTGAIDAVSDCEGCERIGSCKLLWDKIQDLFDMTPAPEHIQETAGKGYDMTSEYGTEALEQILKGLPPGGVKE
jgi:hypothetical protein